MAEFKKDNEILVEFDFVIDLDLAIYKFIKDKYKDSEYVDNKIINIDDINYVIGLLITRENINPLEIIMPSVDTSKLYDEIINNNEEELLKYALPNDAFYLMVTYLLNSTAFNVNIWCRNELESNFIKKFNSKLNTVIIPTRQEIDLSKYVAIYIKYFMDTIKYRKLEGKNIYITSARYNYEKDKITLLAIPSIAFGDVNIVKVMDTYVNIKYTPHKGEDIDVGEDIFEYSSGEESTGDPETDAWYNI